VKAVRMAMQKLRATRIT